QASQGWLNRSRSVRHRRDAVTSFAAGARRCRAHSRGGGHMQTDVNEVVRTVLNVGTRVALQLIGAFVMWFVGRRLIDLAMRLVSRAMAHQNIDTTLVGYVTSSLSV